jgi:GntR family transcriptional regulator
LSLTAKIVPMYHQVYLTLRNDLDHGKYRADRPFPSEIVLAKKFGVSRVTLRHTMSLLERDGLIVRKRGVGTFAVLPDSRVKFSGTMESFNETASSASKRYVTTLLGSQSMATPRFILEQCPPFGKSSLQVKQVSRIKTSREPIHFGTHYFPSALVDGFAHPSMTSLAISKRLREAGLTPDRTDLVITTAPADLEAAKILDIKAGSPLIVTKRLTLDAAGKPIDFLYSFTRPDLYEYVFRFSAGDSKGSVFRSD